jgi:hypothetical protein
MDYQKNGADHIIDRAPQKGGHGDFSISKIARITPS